MKLFRILGDAIADEADGLGRIGKAVKPADYFTMGNAFCGMLAASFVSKGNLTVALILLLAGVILDATDGIAARVWGGGPLGGFLDSLADLVTFGVVPATILATSPTIPAPIRFLVSGFYLACAMVRLARFEALREPTPPKFYNGMTSTGAAAILVALIFAGASDFWLHLAAIILGVWMVSRIRTLKLNWWHRIFGVAAILPLILVPTGFVPLEVGQICLITGMALYTFIGPIYIFYKFGPTPNPKDL